MGKKKSYWLDFWSQRGFSLLEVTIVLGLTGLITMFMMGAFDQQNKLTSQFKNDADLNDLKNSFQTLLRNTSICEINMAQAKGTDLDFFLLEAEEPFATVNQRFKNSNLMIRKMRILTDAEVAADPKITPYPVSDVDGFTNITFRVSVQRLNKSNGGSDINLDFQIPVYMGEIVPKAGPTPSNVKAQCFDAGFKVADSLYRHRPEFDSPGEEPLYCPNSTPARCFGFCVRYTGPNLKVLYCGE